MKARRPEKFSDSTIGELSNLPRDILEYKLETLTAREGQFIFEAFCRKLLEKEICPNIKPPTGPSAGGDGKTDLTTYPVSDELAIRYFTSAPNLPTDSRWAFAISCQKKWKPKIKDDISKIAGLDREFKRVFFISSQFIEKGQRDELEIELTKKYGFEVDILDRAWIVEKVIENKREQLAIENLSIDIGVQKKPILGPRDYKRQQELDNLERDLSNPDEYYGNDAAIIQDYLHAAELSRGLDNPRDKTDGLYLKARQIAKIWNDPKLILSTGYHHAWTTYWWYNDIEGTANIYAEIEPLLNEFSDADDCEKYSNLIKLIRVSEVTEELNPEIALSHERIARLQKELKRNAEDKKRPNNALHAKSLLLRFELMDALYNQTDTRPIFEELTKCLQQAEGLGTYPANRFIDSLTDLGDMIGNLPGYDEMFSEIVKFTGKRLGETQKGELLFKRALQQAGSKKYRLALENLGHAKLLLQKEETQELAIHSILACSDTYMSMGLLWAARSEALVAAHIALKKTNGSFLFPWEGLLACKRLVWIEILLGRIPAVLGWYQIVVGVFNYLKIRKYKLDSTLNEMRSMDNVLSCLMMKIGDEDIELLKGLESILDKMELWMFRSALLYRRGQFDKLLKEVSKNFAQNKTELDQLFGQAKEQPAFADLPPKLCMTSNEYSVISSTIFQVKFEIRVRNRFGTWAFAENLIGVIEAALALARWEDLAFIVDNVKYIVDINSNGTNPPPMELEKCPSSNTYDFYWKEDIAEWIYKADRAVIIDHLKDILLITLVHITIDPQEDLIKELDRWHSQDTFSRALGMSPTIIALHDLLGDSSYDLETWKKRSGS